MNLMYIIRVGVQSGMYPSQEGTFTLRVEATISWGRGQLKVLAGSRGKEQSGWEAREGLGLDSMRTDMGLFP